MLLRLSFLEPEYRLIYCIHLIVTSIAACDYRGQGMALVYWAGVVQDGAVG